MRKKDNSNYMFTINDANSNSNGFEDIVSDSSKAKDIYSSSVDLSSYSNKKRYAKKKRGILGAVSKWWKKRKSWQKASLITAVSLLLVFCLGISIVKIMFDYNYNSITNNPEELGFENVLDKNIVNVALFGIDTRSPDSFEGLSDSIMILSLNTETKKVKIISVMRDTLTPITYNGKTRYNKINSAYKTGGPELAIKTLNTIFNLDISEYATVNFFGMADIIEAVGGIDAELTSAEVVKSDGTLKGINGCIDEICAQLGLDSSKYHIFTAGKHHLNGVQAVAYSRIRYVANIWGTNNDYGRTDRQRYVMEQLFNKALTLDKSQYVKLAKSLIPCSETSLSYTEIMGLAFDILLKSPTFEQTRIPQQEYQMSQPNAGVGSVVYYDLDFAAKLIHAFIYDDVTPEAYVEANGIEKNDWYGKKFGNSGNKNNNGSGSNSGSSSTVDTSSETDSSSGDDSSDISSEEEPVTSGSSSDSTSESSSGSSESSGGDDSSQEETDDTSSKEPDSEPENSQETTTNPDE